MSGSFGKEALMSKDLGRRTGHAATRRLFLGTLSVAWGTAAWAAPTMEKMDLFEAGKGGYATYRIPGIVVTSKGTLLAYCEARKELRGDWGDIDILLRRSTDGGRSWSEPQVLADVKAGEAENNPMALKQGLGKAGGDLTANNPVAIADPVKGTVHFLYCVEYARCFHMRSEDDGRSFSKPVEITPVLLRFRREYGWKVLATGPGHGIRLRNGRLLVPVWLSTGEGGHAHRPSCVSVIYSDDNGKTWERGEIVVNDGVTYAYPREKGGGAQALVNPSETLAVQLNDGRVMLNIRTESLESRRAVTWSRDGATGWAVPVFDPELYEPTCMAAIIRHSEKPRAKRNRILFANPDSRHVPKKTGNWRGSRENLTVKLSYDEGESWPVAKVVDAGISGYSDLAVGPDGTIYCLYERGGIGADQFRTAYLTLARFNLEWLTDGKDKGE